MRIKIGSDYSGVGAFNQAIQGLNLDYEEVFACDMDKFARKTFVLNFGNENDIQLANSKKHDAICDKMLKIVTANESHDEKHSEFFAEAESFAQQFSFYYPFNVYKREIPANPIDLYMTSPPCQGFSLAGKREGSILFFNSLEFIQKNQPRFFIFENVKGLLSHEKPTPKHTYGSTFQEWINCLGGKSVNGVHTFFPHENSVPYHIYFDVLNAKDYGVPQNRERVFIIGIRDDEDNNFQFPKPFPLTKRLKDILETNVDEKYFLSDKMIKVLTHHQNKIIENDNPEESCTIHAGYFKMGGRDQQYVKDANFSSELNQVGSLYENNSDAGRIYDTNSVSCTLKSEGGGGGAKTGLYLVENEVKGGAIRGRYPENPKSRVAGLETKQTLEINSNPDISNTLTTVEKDNVLVINSNTEIEPTILGYTRDEKGKVTKRSEQDYANTIHTSTGGGGSTDQFVKLEGKVFELRTDEGIRQFEGNVCGTLRTSSDCGDKHTMQNFRIRKLTPRECFRLMGFDDSFKYNVSDSQAYKQAGNSIVKDVLMLIIKNLKIS